MLPRKFDTTSPGCYPSAVALKVNTKEKSYNSGSFISEVLSSAFMRVRSSDTLKIAVPISLY